MDRDRTGGLQDIVVEVQDLVCPAKEMLPQWGKIDAATLTAVKKPVAQHAFQALHLQRYGRLRPSYLVGRTREAFLFGDDDEAPQQIEIKSWKMPAHGNEHHSWAGFMQLVSVSGAERSFSPHQQRRTQMTHITENASQSLRPFASLFNGLRKVLAAAVQLDPAVADSFNSVSDEVRREMMRRAI